MADIAALLDLRLKRAVGFVSVDSIALTGYRTRHGLCVDQPTVVEQVLVMARLVVLALVLCGCEKSLPQVIEANKSSAVSRLDQFRRIAEEVSKLEPLKDATLNADSLALTLCGPAGDSKPCNTAIVYVRDLLQPDPTDPCVERGVAKGCSFVDFGGSTWVVAPATLIAKQQVYVGSSWLSPHPGSAADHFSRLSALRYLMVIRTTTVLPRQIEAEAYLYDVGGAAPKSLGGVAFQAEGVSLDYVAVNGPNQGSVVGGRSTIADNLRRAFADQLAGRAKNSANHVFAWQQAMLKL